METKNFKEIKTVEAAKAITGKPESFRDADEATQKWLQAMYDAACVCEAVRTVGSKDKVIDWSNGNQPKYAPWFWMSPSSFAFYSSYYDNTHAHAGCGSRLRVFTKEECDHVATFTEVWKAVQLG